MPNYQTPDVYIEEVSTGTRPIEAVGTSTAGFVGVAPNAEASVNKAVAITNWTQFLKEFAAADSPGTPLAQAVYGFFLNGGSRCYVVNVGSEGTIVGGGRPRAGLEVLEEIDDVAIVLAPGYSDPGSYDALLNHCEKLKDRIAILDAPQTVPNLKALTQIGTRPVARRPRRGAEAEGGAGAETAPEAEGEGGMRPRPSDYGAVYFPWILVRNALNPKEELQVPPSGHVAGIYARTDATRGVHKAPANELVRGALNVVQPVTREDQGDLNTNGVNCIRLFATEGIRVWGARTLAPSASEWRYLNVRRLFNMIEESIARATRWVVFEPNDMSLWKSIRRDISAFLTLLWRQGALMGRTAEEAFFVKCDDETNPPEVIDSGTVITVIGIAPVKPAEFVVFRIGQSAGGTVVEAEA